MEFSTHRSQVSRSLLSLGTEVSRIETESGIPGTPIGTEVTNLTEEFKGDSATPVIER